MMKLFNWLHLTDLHFGLRGQASLWPNVREAFWDDLEKLHDKSGPWHAVLFTGDLVQSGNKAEFTELEDKVLGPLWQHLARLGSKEPVLLAVPGNHDLVRPDPQKPKAALRLLLQKNRFAEIAEEFWGDPHCEYRAIIADAFANYADWSLHNTRVKGVNIRPGVLPGDFVASLDVPTGEGKPLKIGIAGINTTFLQLANGDFLKRLSFDYKQLHLACGEDLPVWAKSHDACILMTHQGPEWFDESAEQNAYTEINPAGRFAVHLFGHMHASTLRRTAIGGGKSIRQWQGSSLFGLEKFGEPPQIDRRHGYGAGRIEFDDDGAAIRHWPRSAIKSADGWRFSPDHNSCVLTEGDGCTAPERLDNRTGNTESDRVSIGAQEMDVITQEVKTDHHRRLLRELELRLGHALEAFKGQPTVFIEPKLSKTREFNEEPNALSSLMEKPRDTLILAPPEFGLTCLGLHMQLEALKKRRFWLYIDAEHTKGRKIADLIDEELLHYNNSLGDLECIVLDSWDANVHDHLKMVKQIVAKCPTLPLVILATDSLISNATAHLSKLNRSFELLHLQALSRSSMRKLVAGYNKTKKIGAEDVVLSSLAGHLESINIHRTPLNCYTLLRVLDSNYNEKLLNKSKLLKAILFLLFTDHYSFSHLSEKPEVEECVFVMGCFCRQLVKQGTRFFDSDMLAPALREICSSRGIVLNVDAMLDVLLENNILVRRGKQMEFRHRYWIFYFAAEWMQHDDGFRQFILNDRNYINYPEIIEFYTGIDGKRSDALATMLSDLNLLIEEVDRKIGIERAFDPISPLLWSPTDEFIQQTRSQIAERVESSNLPAEIKDKHADAHYRSTEPYDQSIRSFLKDYSVLSLVHSIRAASSALRSSPFVDIALKHNVTKAIFQGWEEISRVAFWLSPILAAEGIAIHDGLAIRLAEGFSENIDQRFKQIIVSNPYNVTNILGSDLASRKIGPLLDKCFHATGSMLQKHMIALFIVIVRPSGWEEATLRYINLLHPRSFYLGDILSRLTHEVTFGDLEHGEEPALKRLTRAIISKREYAAKGLDEKEIPRSKLLSDDNRLPIDQLLKGNQRSWPSI